MDSAGVRAGGRGPGSDRLWRQATSPLRFEPGYLIVGAMKAGTTFLHACLTRHPSCAGPPEKELHFFDNNFHRGARWYRSRFPIRAWMECRRRRRMISGEASPYYLFHPLAPERARGVCPGARILVLLRDPVDRAYSHYQQNVRVGFERLSFEAALEAEAERLRGEEDRLRREPGYYSAAHQTFSYVARGEYVEQVARWIEAFGRERVLVLQSERLWDEPEETYGRVLDFLGLEQRPPRAFRPRNRGRYEAMSAATRARLADGFEPANERLFALLGERFDWAADAPPRHLTPVTAEDDPAGAARPTEAIGTR